MEISQNASNSTKKPSCISSDVWKRFEALKKRTDDVTKRSTEKRIKHLQKNILQNVEAHMSSEEEKAVLKKHNVHLNSESEEPQESAVPVTSKLKESQRNPSNTCGTDTEKEKYKELEQYLGVNDHLKQGACINGGPKSGLEKQIEAAIEKGDLNTAEKLSDRLSTRDYGVKIAEAFDARDYSKRKKKEDDKIQAKKKKKLAWGFDHKQRWETKSNM